MPSVDERVVSMAFENQVFEQRVSQTMTTLTKLDTAIKNIGASTGLENIEKAANKVTLQGPMSALDKLRARLSGAGQGAAEGLGEIDKAGNKVTLEGPVRAIDKVQGRMDQLSAGSTFSDIEKASNQVELGGLTRAINSVAGQFSMLQGVATVALGNIAAQATLRGGAFAKSFAFGPLQQGLSEYQTNLGSIQTILANTQGQQVTGLQNVNKYLGELNEYSDRTIYNFGEMAKNIGTFTAAGVDLPKSTEAIKGIANLAALSGSNSQQASTAMYQLSQAIAAGRVGLQDWNSVVNAGMGGAVFQKALMRTAENMGEIEKGALEIDKATGKATINGQSFRESIMAKPGEQSWLTSDVLTKTLGQFTGDLTDAQLAAEGFSAEQIKAIQAQAKTAQAAATEVKTLPQVFDVARETIGSGWAKTFSLIFGDFKEAKETFTDFSNFINNFINKVSDARNKVLAEWKKLGGRVELIEGIKAAFDALMGIITPIKDAFREIFPAQTGRTLFELTKNFRELMESIKPSPELVARLQRIFAGLFAVVHIGWGIVKQFVGVIFDLFGVAGEGSGGFLDFVASIADFLVSVDRALTQGGLLKELFKGIGTVLAIPIRLLKVAAEAIGNLFGIGEGDKAQGFEDSIRGVNDALVPLEGVINKVIGAWEKFVEILGVVKNALEPWFSQLTEELSGVGDILADAFKGLDFDKIMQGLQVGFIGGIFLTLKKAFGGAGGGVLGGIRDALSGVNDLLQGFTGVMEGMQKKLQAEALLAIGAAIALLAAGIFVLSTIDGDKLAKAMTAVAVGLGQLVGAMKFMTTGMGKVAVLQFPVIAAGMIALAVSMVILSGAMKIFSTMSWEDIGKGLAAVAGSIAGIALAMKLMPGGGAGLVLQAAGLTLLGVALNLVATSVKIFATMSWENLAKGLLGVAGAIAGIGLAMQLVPLTLPITAAGLVILAVGLNAIAVAVGAFGGMNLDTLAKGILGMAAAIVAIGLAVAFIPPTLPLTAAGLLVVGSAMVVTAGAIALLGSMNLGTLVKGIAALGATLIVLAAGLTAMIASLPGAGALMIAATALAVLVPVLGILGTMKWSTIFKGLATIAAVMVTIGIAGIAAAPGLIALGIALVPLGIGLMAVAGAAKIFASAVAMMSSEGQKGFALLLTAITAFIALIPNLIISFVKGLVGIVDQIVVLAPKIIEGLSKILTTIIAFIIEQAPKLALAIGALITAIAKVITDNTPTIIATGAKLVQALLTGIANNITSITSKAAEIVVKFLNALTTKAPQLVRAGARTLAAFIRGIASKIGDVIAAVAGMVVKFIQALTRNIPRIVSAAQDLMLAFIGAIVGFVPKMIQKGIDIIISFLDGIQKTIPRVKNKAVSLARTFVTNLADGLVELVDVGFRTIIRFLNGLERTIRENHKKIWDAGFGVADAIIDGLWYGLEKLGPKIISKIDDIILALPKKALSILGIGSPSKVFMDIGKFTMQGFAKGIDDNAKSPGESVVNSATEMINRVKDVLGIRSPSKVMEEIGKGIGKGFAVGLRGSVEDIREAFDWLRSRLAEDIRSTRELIRADREQLEAELAKKASERDPKLIAELQAAIRQNTADLKKMTATRQTLNTGLKSEKNELIGLAKAYDKVTVELEEAEQALKEAVAARDEAAKGFTQKYAVMPTIDEGTTLEEFKRQLQERIVAVQRYHATLQALRRAGLDDTTYELLLEQGTAGQKFADQLLAGGVTAVHELNALDKDLQTAAKTLGEAAADNLHAAGIMAAKGLVEGLQSEKANLEKVMEDLANTIVRAIKRKLRIRSPSEIFAQVGKFISEGLVRGLEDSSNVTAAATKLGEDVLTAMSSAISNEIDVDPVISPVLDLTNVEKEAEKLKGMIPVPTLTAATSFDQAMRISDQKAVLDAVDKTQVVPTTTVSFEQNNYSPDPLTNIEIYRQTNNQLSRVRDLVGLPS